MRRGASLLASTTKSVPLCEGANHAWKVMLILLLAKLTSWTGPNMFKVTYFLCSKYACCYAWILLLELKDSPR